MPRSCELHSPHGDDFVLSRGDRVVQIVDNGKPEYGWVRWLGRLNIRDSLELMAGVEFDNPVGNERHIIRGNSLFEAKVNHGSLLPASVLIPIEDLEMPMEYLTSSKKVDDVLGGDICNLSPFHKMAFEQLSGSKVTNEMLESHRNRGKEGAPLRFSKEKENWDILPSMSYTSSKNMDSLADFKQKSYKSHSKSLPKPVSTSHLENKHEPRTTTSYVGSYSHRTSTKSPLSYRDVPLLERALFAELEIDSMNGRREKIPERENDTKFHTKISPNSIGENQDPDRESPNGYLLSSFYNLSHNGVNQVKLVTEAEGLQMPENPIDSDACVGSLVEVTLCDDSNSDLFKPIFGVIRWIGVISNGDIDGLKIAGIEMEDADEGLSDGTFDGQRYFNCNEAKGFFVPLVGCAKDSRFIEDSSTSHRVSLAFGSTDCQPIFGSIPPVTSADVRGMFGRNKGIQGHQNSCYLDATLFSMFAFTSVFDGLLFRPPTDNDIGEYCDVQAVLREEIVNPLRANMYVRADHIMKLRTMLDHLSSVRGLTTEEKDPEEFLQSLLAQLLRAEPLLQLSSGQEAYHYQLFVDKDDKISLPSVQTLFDQSFLTSDIKLKAIPSCLIIQMPRFGKDYKMYPRILPSMVLDVTDVIEDSPRQCIICGKLAQFECRECFGHCGSGLESIAFCAKCMDKVHSHKKRGCHTLTRQLRVPPEFQMLAAHCGSIPRVYMELFAVVCIETSHYVTFTRCGSGAQSTWCFFDSMADRKGEQHGYNIPTVTECSDIMQWVGEEGSQMLHTVTDNKALPDLPRRLLCDAYMCFYQSPKVMMYS